MAGTIDFLLSENIFFLMQNIVIVPAMQHASSSTSIYLALEFFSYNINIKKGKDTYLKKKLKITVVYS